ncbi:MAG: hypothetical protein ABIH38_05415 [Patescibacteria group bacterium]
MQNKIAIIVFSFVLAIITIFVTNNIKSASWVENPGCAYYSVGWPIKVDTLQDNSKPVPLMCGSYHDSGSIFRNTIGNILFYFSSFFLVGSLIFHRKIKNFKRFLLIALIIAVVYLILDFSIFHIYFQITRNIYI